MTIKILEPIHEESSLPEEESSTIVGFYHKKININYIVEIQEMINHRTKKPYKNRCLLKTDDQWVIANHSFDELCELKKNRTIIKGFYGKTSRRSS